MIKRIEKLIIILIAMLIIIICNTNISNANDILTPNTFDLWYVNDNKEYEVVRNLGIGSNVTLTASTWTLEGNDSLYCIQNGQAFHDTNTIRVVEHIQIVGNKSTDHLGNSITDKRNGRLAFYISYLKNEHKAYHEANCRGKQSNGIDSNKDNCIIQNAFWNFMSSWMGNGEPGAPTGVGEQHGWHEGIGIYASMANGNPGYNTSELDEKAVAYADGIVDGGTDEIVDKTGKVDISINNANFRIGPFKWEFSGSLEEIKINDRNVSGMTITCYEGDTEKSIGVNEISSGKEFYINIPINSGISVIEKISAKAKLHIKQADIWFFENTVSNCQNIIYVDSTESDKYFSKDLTYKIPLTGTLKIGKFDQNTGTALANVEFRLYNTDIKQYVKAGASNTTFTTKVSEAKVYKTNSSGEIIISNLIIGNYQIQETKNPDQAYGTELKNKDVYVSADITDTSEKIIQTTYNIIASSESIRVNKSKTKQEYIEMLYTAILNRTADADGLKTWSNIIVKTDQGFNNPSSIRAVLTGLITSNEFNTRNPNIKTEVGVNEYINRLYAQVLGRNASAFELAEHRYKAYNGYTGVGIENKKKLVELTVQKVDKTTGNRLGGISFSIKMTSGEKNGKYLGYDGSGKAVYYDKEHVMYTNATKDIVIKQVYQGNYEFKEIKNPNQGYVTNVNKVVQTGNITMTDTAKITIKVENRREYIDISGYVWEDAHWSDGKGFVGNSLYKEGTMDANDKLVPNINVYLRKVTGTNQNEHVMNTKTDANGKYEFKNVKIDELNKYYIVFEYNGVLYKSVDEINTNKANGSKAKEGTTGGKSAREEFNKKFTTIVPGQALDANGNKTKDLKYETTQVTNVFDGSQSNESKILYNNSYDKVSDAQKVTGYPITGVDREYLIQSDTSAAYGGYLDKIYTADYIRKNGITKIENINQGLIERVQPSLTVGEDIYSARVEFNGESHIYEYSKRGEFTKEYTEDGIKRYGPTVKFEKGDYQKLSYVRAMYASDIKKAEENKATLSLHVTYAIKMTNGSGHLNLKVNQIADYFDSKYLKALRYGTTVNDKGIPQNAKEIIESQVQDINGVSTYKKAVLDVNLEIGAEKTETVYVEFEVNPNEIYKILNKDDEDLVKLDNIVEINSYSVTDENKKPYAGICINSQPGNLKVEDPEDATIKFNNTYECDTAYAPGLTLTLQEARSTSGKVFLDETSGELKQREIRQGNGLYDDGEKGIEDVGVQLIKPDGTQVQVYDENEEVWKLAEATTNDSGEYTISGFIPGEYTIQYTWGDKIYKVQDYKSTIVDESVWTNNEENKEWYKDTEPRRSDAVDNYGTREEIDNQVKDVTYATQSQIDKYEDGVIGGSDLIDNITASTQPFKVNIEYITSKTTVDDEYETAQNGVTIPKDGFKNRIEKIDFGIVERARQILDLNKRITNIKITLANGSELINTKVDKDGNFSNPTQYIVYLPESSDTAQVKVEIDSEIVQGATLELTYGLNVTNISEVEYATEEFYKYGKGHGETNIVKLTPSKIIDYLDNNINPEVGTGWKYVAETDKTELVEKYLWSGNSEESEEVAHKETISKVINGTSKVVTTDELGKAALEPGQSTNGENSDGPITIVGYKLLSNNEETVLENNAEIIQVTKTGGSTLKTTPGNYIPGETPTEQREPDDATSERLSIIPPTGNGINYISFIILTISSLGIIVAGIILIKKYVLKK